MILSRCTSRTTWLPSIVASSHSTEQGKGLGKALLKDAILRSAWAADIVGCRALVVHAKDSSARAFYQRFGFEPSPINELHLYLLMKDIIASLTAGG